MQIYALMNALAGAAAGTEARIQYIDADGVEKTAEISSVLFETDETIIIAGDELP